MIKQIGKVLVNHWTVLFSMILGGMFGAFFPSYSKNMSFLGGLYLNLLQVAIIPIMIVALISSFYNLFKTKNSFFYIRKIFLWFCFFMCFAVFVSLLVCLLTKPGSHLTEAQLQSLNNGIALNENSIKGLPNIAHFDNFVSYLEGIIPTNIVKAIYDRNDIAIVLFSIIFGISLGLTQNPNVSVAINFFDGVFSAFLRYVNAMMYGLPFGLFFLLSDFVSKAGVNTLYSLLDLILSIYLVVIILFIVLLLFISKKSGYSLIYCLKQLKNPYLIAFGTSSSFAAMPAAMLAIRDSFHIEKQNVELVLPLGVSLFKPGIVVRAICISIFLMSLFHIPFSVTNISILILTSVLCSIASTAGPAILSASMFSMVLAPLGIPPAVGIFLLLSVEPLVDPMTTILNVQSNCTVTILVGGKRSLIESLKWIR